MTPAADLESNLQVFNLVSGWIFGKIHDSWPLSVKSLKSLGGRFITDQHFTSQDFVDAVLGSFKDFLNCQRTGNVPTAKPNCRWNDYESFTVNLLEEYVYKHTSKYTSS